MSTPPDAFTTSTFSINNNFQVGEEYQPTSFLQESSSFGTPFRPPFPQANNFNTENTFEREKSSTMSKVHENSRYKP